MAERGELIKALLREVAEAPAPFRPGETPVPVSGKVIGDREKELMIEAALDGWLTTGRFNDLFERGLGEYVGAARVLTVNSGSSANLLALGARWRGRHVGTFGDLATLSFYPAHHITTGEGGAVFTNDARLAALARSFRDWGRHCHCRPGQDNACGHRFDGQYGDLPQGYDHKYVYSHAGYNLKMTDLQAACGVAQLERLPGFVEKRRANLEAAKIGTRLLGGRVARVGRRDAGTLGKRAARRGGCFITPAISAGPRPTTPARPSSPGARTSVTPRR